MCWRKQIGATRNTEMGALTCNFTPHARLTWFDLLVKRFPQEYAALLTNILSFVNYFSGPVMHRDCPLDCKVYVGNLGSNGNKTELERSFGYYGPLRSVWVARNPPGFAFVEFEDPRDATDAVRELDGR